MTQLFGNERNSALSHKASYEARKIDRERSNIHKIYLNQNISKDYSYVFYLREMLGGFSVHSGQKLIENFSKCRSRTKRQRTKKKLSLH